MITWTRQSLRDLIQQHFGGMRIIVVSNREPYIHEYAGDGRIVCLEPASGMARALDPVLRTSRGVWVAHGSGKADAAMVDEADRIAVPPDKPRYTLRRVWLDPQVEQGYYYGLANEGIWPLCHAAFQRPVFRPGDWECYRKANRQFASAVLEEAGGGPAFVFIQDYHLGLLPRMLKESNSDLVVGQFWHIPWPNRETFRVFPWKEELLDGLLGNDLLGFHLHYHCLNFLDTIDRGLEAMVDTERLAVTRRGHVTAIRPFPISIDSDEHFTAAQSPEVDAAEQGWRERLGGKPEFLGIGIDRIDYTKGLPDRIAALDLLFREHPEYRGRLVFVQVAVPSRSRIPAYCQLGERVANQAAELNRRWGTADWQPIVFLARHCSRPELMALHRLADFCMVTSLHDGMNLVAKEFVATRAASDAVLILSAFTGAAREFADAVQVNPFAPHEMSGAIHAALTMSAGERQARMRRMWQTLERNNVYTWAAGVFSSLIELGVNTRSERARAAGALP